MTKKLIMPAEWEMHERTLIEWCVKDSLVFEENYNEVAEGYAETVNAISQFEPVTVIVNENHLKEAKSLCNGNVHFLEIEHNDAWCRDNGPTFVRDENGEISGINWQFNAWGERFLPYDLDNEVAPKVIEHFGKRQVDSQIVLEGGSIHSNGDRIILTTKECLLNSNRNPNLNQKQIEKELVEKLGANQVIWLNKGLFGDETDGHIDNIACFVDKNTVMIQVCNDVNDENFEITRENLQILENFKTENGEKLNIIKIDQPPKRLYKGIRLTLSYINFYIVNNGIILPIFGGDAVETDEMAIMALQGAFPDRKIVTIDGMKLVKEGGNVHCITQQMPL